MKRVPEKITLREVAKSANVSVAVASRVLGNHGYVSEEKKKKVRIAAKKLGYAPNFLARSLKTASTSCLGIVIADITTNFFTLLVRGADDVGRQNGYHLIVCNSDEDPEKERVHLEELWNRKVDGIIICPTEKNLHRLRMFRRFGMPLVLVDRRLSQLDAVSITVDNRLGAFEGVTHLLQHGYRRIAIMKGLPGIASLEERFEGYSQALKQAGMAVDPRLIRYGELNAEISKARAGELLELEKRPDAFFISSEAMIIGTINAIQERGLRIPQDVGVVAFDDPLWTSILRPPLTAIRQPSYSVGTIAAQTLISQLAGKVMGPIQESITLRPELVVRGSCREELPTSRVIPEGTSPLPR
jgi:DNA-binding LacI/PurR family transcriptional regulator